MNRRRLLTSLLVGSSAAMLCPHAAFAASRALSDKKDPSKKQSLFVTQQVIRSTHSDFDLYLNRYFPELDRVTLFKENLRSHAVLIINQGAIPVYGYSVAWKTYEGGRRVEMYRRTIMKSPSSQLNKRMVSMSQPLVQPNQALLATPFFIINSKVYQRGKDRFPGKTILSTATVAKNSARYPVAAGYVERNTSPDRKQKVVLEAVLFSDRAVGPNAVKASNKVRNILNAEHDEAKFLLDSSLQQNGRIAIDKFRDGLRISSSKFRTISRSEMTTYDRARYAFSRKFSGIARRGREREITRILETVSRQPRARIY